jgi:hypothetical protein
MAGDLRRFYDKLTPVPIDPKEERDLRAGKAAALAGKRADPTKSPAWQRGHQLGTYQQRRS